MSNELTEYRAISPVENIKKMIGNGVSMADLKEFLKMQEDWEKREAEKAFNIAMSEFKKDVPTILKTQHVKYATKAGDVVEYYHADLGVIVATLIPVLAKFGFDHSWQYSQDSNGIRVTCIITHKQGHSKSNSLVAPPDSSGGKNTIQAISSTTTYLERYTFFGSLGLAAKGMDDDGRSSETKPEKKTLTPEDAPRWKQAVNAYKREKGFKSIDAHAEISDEHKALICYQVAHECFEKFGNFEKIAGYEGITEEIKNRIIDEKR
jgi:hypothetical protein